MLLCCFSQSERSLSMEKIGYEERIEKMKRKGHEEKKKPEQFLIEFWRRLRLSRDFSNVEMGNKKGTQVNFDTLPSAKSGLKFLIKIEGFRETLVAPFRGFFFFAVSLEKICLHCQKKRGFLTLPHFPKQTKPKPQFRP